MGTYLVTGATGGIGRAICKTSFSRREPTGVDGSGHWQAEQLNREMNDRHRVFSADIADDRSA